MTKEGDATPSAVVPEFQMPEIPVPDMPQPDAPEVPVPEAPAAAEQAEIGNLSTGLSGVRLERTPLVVSQIMYCFPQNSVFMKLFY